MSSRLDRHSITLMKPLRVALVDEDESLQDAVRGHFTGPEVGWQVDSYADAASALKDILASPPNVVLMDVFMPGMSGIDCTRKLRARLPELPVLIFTARADAGTLLKAMMAGACGYVIKPVSPANLAPHVRKALNGGLAIGPRAERFLLEGFRELRRSGSASGLSWREQELMLCLCQHRSNNECATALGISEATVHAHLATIFKKLNVHDRESALRVFMEQFYSGGGG